MRETIQRLIEAEEEAKRRVHAARLEADQMLSSARKHAAEAIAQARTESAHARSQFVERACTEARLERERLLADTASRLERDVRLDPGVAQRAVEAIVRRVCGL